MNIARTIVLALSLVGGGSVAIFACSPPQMYCTSAYGHYAVVLDLQNTNDEEGECASLNGDHAYIETYADELSDGQADWSQGNVVITTEFLYTFQSVGAEHGVVDDTNNHYARAEFTQSNPDANGFCDLAFESPARLELEEIPPESGRGVGPAPHDGWFARLADGWASARAGFDEDDDTGTGTGTGDSSTGDDDDAGDDDDDPPFPGQPAIDLTVAWSDMRIYATPDAQGTQFEGTMTITLNDCEATYRAVGLYPSVSCMSDDDCEDEASGINPSFDVTCNQDAGLCTLAKPMPSYE